jgi:L-ascorbate metabolism protein UlaG (beta-lactamase superfamily)
MEAPGPDEGPPPPDRASAWRAWFRLLLSRQGHDGPRSDHFDGRHFLNEGPADAHSFLRLLRWRLSRTEPPMPARPPDARPAEPAPPRRVEGDALRVTWINHSTVLLQTAGINLLTDPIWSDRAGPTARIGSRRCHPPGLALAALPPVDVVLVSHNHYDHLDLPTLRALGRRDRPQFFTSLGNARLLRAEGLGAVAELDWWQEVPLPGGLRLAALPARHFSSRGLRDRNRTLWCGFMILGSGGPVYFAADTGYGPHFAEIRRRHGCPRLALLPIGAYRPRWFMAPVHLSPAEAVRAHLELNPGTSLAIHFDTFLLADDGAGEAVRDLASALAEAGPAAANFHVPAFGQGRDIA